MQCSKSFGLTVYWLVKNGSPSSWIDGNTQYTGGRLTNPELVINTQGVEYLTASISWALELVCKGITVLV